MGVVTESQPWHGYRDLGKEKTLVAEPGSAAVPPMSARVMRLRLANAVESWQALLTSVEYFE